MAFLDFFRRSPALPSRPPRQGILKRIINLFNRSADQVEETAPPEPEEPIYYDQFPEEVEPVDISDLAINYNEPYEENGVQFGDLADLDPALTWKSDTDLLEEYGDMYNTMVDKGYIHAFDSEQEEAEFLRALSSDAWREIQKFVYSASDPEALSQLQGAIERGATAGALQKDYNSLLEKKSNSYLEAWEEMLQHDENYWKARNSSK